MIGLQRWKDLGIYHFPLTERPLIPKPRIKKCVHLRIGLRRGRFEPLCFFFENPFKNWLDTPARISNHNWFIYTTLGILLVWSHPFRVIPTSITLHCFVKNSFFLNYYTRHLVSERLPFPLNLISTNSQASIKNRVHLSFELGREGPKVEPHILPGWELGSDPIFSLVGNPL